jgi:DNA-binding response OmpR family regulator
LANTLAQAPDVRTGCLRVLVVDDNRDAADTLAHLVRLWGHDTRVRYDGCDVLAAAEAFRPDVVLLDIALPTVDGNDLARQFRGRATLRKTTLIAVTGFSDERHRILSAEAGFDHFLLKPTDPGELRQLLASLDPLATRGPFSAAALAGPGRLGGRAG